MAGMTTTTSPPPPHCFDSPAHAQRGMGMMGFLATAIPVIWLGLGGVELAHWMQLRQALSLILLDAARVGTTRQAEPDAMARAFEQGLRHLHPAPGELTRILAGRRRDLGLPWHIAIQLPGRQAFADHADPTLQRSAGGGRRHLIRNDHQAEQYAARQAQGWPQGRGPVSRLTIHEANTLRIALRWPHKPLLPGVAVLMKTLAPMARDPRNRQWMTAGYLPFRRTVTVAMQSHPADWPDLPDGRITHETAPFQAPAPYPGADASPRPPASQPTSGSDVASSGNGNGNHPPSAFDEPAEPGPDIGKPDAVEEADAMGDPETGLPGERDLCGP